MTTEKPAIPAWKPWACRTLCILLAALAAALILIPRYLFTVAGNAAAGIVRDSLGEGVISSVDDPEYLAGLMCICAVFAALTGMVMYTLSVDGRRSWFTRGIIYTLVFCAVVAAASSSAGYSFNAMLLLASVTGVTGAAAIRMMYKLLSRKLPSVINRETCSYVVFGVITTVINIVLFGRVYRLLTTDSGNSIMATTVSNAVAWTGAVIFAFLSNKLFVFNNRSRTGLGREILLFLGARLFSLAVDMAGMLLLINLMHVNESLSKIAMNVVVLIMNYFFSKLFIFKKTDKV